MSPISSSRVPRLVRGVTLAVCVALACRPHAPVPAGGSAPRSGVTRRGLYYEVVGRGDPVVLAHGFHTDRREWDEVAAALAATRRVIRYDLRGHGRSADARAPFAAHEDLEQLLEELGARRADLVGLSAGSTVVLELALERPDLVRRLVMVSPGLPGVRVDASREWMRPIASAVRAGQWGRAAELWWESPIMEGTRGRGAAGLRYRRMVLDNARIWRQDPRTQRPLVPSAAERLARLCPPLLVVVGAEDATGSQQQADSIASRLPGAARIVLPGAGHMISTERPAELAAAVSSFLGARPVADLGCAASGPAPAAPDSPRVSGGITARLGRAR